MNTQYHTQFKNIDKRAIRLVRTIIKRGLFKSTNTLEFKKDLIKDLHLGLCDIYNLEVIPLEINSNLFNCYRHIGKIELDKPSLISYLHEFRHYFEIKRKGRTTEKTARGYSISLYFLATPNLCINAINRGFIIHQNIILNEDKN